MLRGVAAAAESRFLVRVVRVPKPSHSSASASPAPGRRSSPVSKKTTLSNLRCVRDVGARWKHQDAATAASWSRALPDMCVFVLR